MKLLHVVPSYLPAWRYGGPIRSVHGLCRALAGLGHQVAVATTDADGPRRLDVSLGVPVDREGVEVRYFPMAFPARLYRSPALLAWVRRALAGFDLVHLHSVFLWPTSAVAREGARRGVPYLVSPRGMLVPELLRARGRLRKAAWLRLVERRTLREAAAVHLTTPLELREAGRTGLPLPSPVIVPNGLDPDEVEASTGGEATPPAVPYVLYLGRLAPKKGLERLVGALEAVPDLDLVVAGNDEGGHGEAVRRLAAASSVSARIHFPGEVRGETKRALLAGARALVLPSDSENFGNVVLESLAAGRPAIVSTGVGLADAVRDGRCGWVVEPTPEGIAAALAALVASPSEADAMGERGRALVAERFAWPAVARSMVAAYEDAIARSGRRRGAAA